MFCSNIHFTLTTRISAKKFRLIKILGQVCLALNPHCAFTGYVLLGKLLQILSTVICSLPIMNSNVRTAFRTQIKPNSLYIKNVKTNKVLFGKAFKVNDMEKI